MKRFFILLIALCSAVTFWACEDLLSNLLPQKPDNDEQVDGSNDSDNDDDEGGNEGGEEGGNEGGNDGGEEGGNDGGNDVYVPTDHDPNVEEPWTVVGAFNQWGSSEEIPNVPMTYNDGVYTAELMLYKGMGFRLVLGHWAVDRGAMPIDDNESATYCALRGEEDGEFDVRMGASDIYIPVAGRYSIEWNAHTDKMRLTLLQEVSDEWRLIDDTGRESLMQWFGKEYPRMFTLDTELESGDKVLFANNRGEYYALITEFEIGTQYDMRVSSEQVYFVVPASGDYHIKLDLNGWYPVATFECDNPVYPESGGGIELTWGIVGGFSEWSNDTYMTYDSERNCYYAEVVMSPTYENFDNGFKLRYAADWGNNRGSVDMLTELPLNCDIAVCHDGYNLPLELAGRYLVEYYYTTETMRVEYLGAM